MSENTYHCPDKLENIPGELKVPEGHVLLLRAYAKGVQIYDCPFVEPPKAVPHAIRLRRAPRRSFLSAGIALATWLLTAQMLAQVSATSFIRIDVPVNNFVADRQTTFQLKP